MFCLGGGAQNKGYYRRYRVRTVDGQDDFASMAEVVRRRYSRVLLEARDKNPDVAEFSQENPADALERAANGDTSETNEPAQFVAVGLPDLVIFHRRQR